MRIALLTTGYTELLGLGVALGRLFPGQDFVAIPAIPAIAGRRSRPFDGFTTNPLPAPPIDVPTAADKLAQSAVALIDPDLPDPYDLALVFDDLELANLDQPDVVLDTFATAVSTHIDRCVSEPGRRARLRQAARARISLHLAVPMIESWFFADPSGVGRAGVSPQTAVRIADGDPERFQTNDPDYDAASEVECTCWVQRNRRKKRRPKWLGATSRQNHPKGYLQWLMIDGTSRGCTRYDEAVGGGRALKLLDWDRALHYRKRCTYLRALVMDLSDALASDPDRWPGEVAVVTRLCLDDPTRTIRNR